MIRGSDRRWLDTRQESRPRDGKRPADFRRRPEDSSTCMVSCPYCGKRAMQRGDEAIRCFECGVEMEPARRFVFVEVECPRCRRTREIGCRARALCTVCMEQTGEVIELQRVLEAREGLGQPGHDRPAQAGGED